MKNRRYLKSNESLQDRASHRWALLLGIVLSVMATPDRAAAQTGPNASAALPKDIVLVLDNSGSMRKNDPRFLTKEAVARFVRGVPNEARLSVVIFDKQVRATPLGSRDSVNLAQFNYRGPLTNIPAAVARAIQELKLNGRPGAARSIVLLTDGVVDTGTKAQDREVTHWLRAQLASDAASSGVKILTVALGTGSDSQLLQELAQRTGGRYFWAPQAQDLPGIFVQISDAFFAPTSTPSTNASAPESISESLGETPEPAADTAVGSSEDAFDRAANKPRQAMIPPAPGLSAPEAPAATAEPLTGEPSVAAAAEKTGAESQASSGGSEPGTARETLSMTEPAASNQNSSAATPSSTVPIEPGAPGIRIMYGLVVIAVLLMGGMLALVAVLVWNKQRVKPAGHETPAHLSLPDAFLLDLSGVTGRKRHQLGTVTVVGRNYLVIDQLGRVPASERNHIVNHIVINRPTIGRVHAVVEHKHRGFWLVDQNSKNGTSVNGNRVNGPVCLTHGDQIQFHDFAFEFALAGMNLADATVVVGGDLTLLRDSGVRATGERGLDKRGNQAADPEATAYGPEERAGSRGEGEGIPDAKPWAPSKRPAIDDTLPRSSSERSKAVFSNPTWMTYAVPQESGETADPGMTGGRASQGKAKQQTPGQESEQSAAGQYVDDAMITAKIKAALAQNPGMSAMAISVKTNDQMAQLTGSVQSDDEKKKAESIARSVAGVKDVENKLAVKG
ncbi:MAG: BON domain-containing protein [Gammaproteobacteria bacterium]